MISKRIGPATCVMLGIAGAVVGAVGGALMATGLSEAAYARMAALILYGAMLLFMAAYERGAGKGARRAKLFLLFLAVLVSILDLPLLCPALEAVALPLFCLLYRSPGLKVRWVVLVVCEIVYFAVRTAGIMPVFGAWTMQVLGAALVAVSAARFAALWQVRRTILDARPN